jgi:hypothetical protein
MAGVEANLATAVTGDDLCPIQMNLKNLLDTEPVN